MLPKTNAINDEVILAARLFLATLFLIFCWRKLRDISGTVSQMVQDGLPTPVLATAVALFMDQLDSMEAFYKNLSIMGGFLLLYVTGAGKYSLDVLCGIAAP